MRTRFIALVAALALASVALGACSTQARAERKGKEAGEQICKAKDTDDAAKAQRHIDRARDKLNDLARYTGRDVSEDLRDLDRNLDQIARGGASSQDINAITRSVEEAKSSMNGNAEAAADGLLEGLADCD